MENNVEFISKKEKRNDTYTHMSECTHTCRETEKEKELGESVRLILNYKYNKGGKQRQWKEGKKLPKK